MGSGEGPGGIGEEMHCHASQYRDPTDGESSSGDAERCSPTCQADPQDAGSHLRSRVTHLQKREKYHHEGQTQIDYLQTPVWHQLGPTQRDHTRHLQIPHWLPIYIRTSNLVS